MGSGGQHDDVDDDPLLANFKSSLEPLTLAEQLDEWCTYYMAIGVPYEEFWYGDYCKLKYYVERHRQELKAKNHELWLQGMYFYEAVGTALARGFTKHSQAKYPDKPYDVVEKTDRELQIEIDERRKAIVRALNKVAEEWNKENGKDSQPDNRDSE